MSTVQVENLSSKVIVWYEIAKQSGKAKLSDSFTDRALRTFCIVGSESIQSLSVTGLAVVAGTLPTVCYILR